MGAVRPREGRRPRLLSPTRVPYPASLAYRRPHKGIGKGGRLAYRKMARPFQGVADPFAEPLSARPPVQSRSETGALCNRNASRAGPARQTSALRAAMAAFPSAERTPIDRAVALRTVITSSRRRETGREPSRSFGFEAGRSRAWRVCIGPQPSSVRCEASISERGERASH